MSDRPPELRLNNASTVCHIVWRPDLVEAVMINELRSHFNQREHLYNDELGLDLFAVNRADEPFISEVGDFHPEDIGRRPSIIFADTDIDIRTNTIGARVDGARVDGISRFMYQVLAGNTIYCIHSRRQSSRLLAWEVFCFLGANHESMRRSFKLDRLRVGGVGKSGPLEENQESWVTPVGLKYIWSQTFVQRELAPLTKRINFTSQDDVFGITA
jgi:hypothetical protein